MKRPILIFILFCALATGCYNRHSAPSPNEFGAHGNCNLSELRGLCEEGFINIESNLVCIGRITSSDRDGNFYRSIIIEDDSGAVEIKLGVINSASQFPVGLMVALNLNGTAAMVENGVVQVGLPPPSFDTAPRELESWEVIDKHIVRSNSVEPREPIIAEIASLDISQCGRFIRVENLDFVPNTEEKESEYHHFVDKDGNSIFLYISSYADFVTMEMAASGNTIQGILYYEPVGMNIGKQFVIKPRFADDIASRNNTL